MRYYYTDPLAAAWMAKYFGMKFTHGQGFEIYLSPHESWSGWYYTQSGIRVHRHPNETLYIHPDSVKLMEPQVGDILSVRSVLGKDKKPYYFYEYKGLASLPDIWKIIQHNGIAFMWPEVEA